MCLRIFLEEVFSRQCPFNVLGWDLPLFDDSVGQHGRRSSMNEIHDPVVRSLPPYTQFVDAIPQEIGFGRRSS